MTPKQTHIRTDRCLGQVVWENQLDTRSIIHAKITHMTIDVAHHKTWTADYYKSVVSELAAELIKIIRDGEFNPGQISAERDARNYVISGNAGILLKYPGGHKIDTHHDMVDYQVDLFADRRPNRATLWGLPLVEIARGEWPTSTVPFPVFRDELSKSINIRLNKLRLVGDQVKKITELRGVDIKVEDFRVDVIRRDEGGILGRCEIEVDVVYYLDEYKMDKDTINLLDDLERDLSRIVNRMVKQVTNSPAYYTVIYHTIEQK